VTRQDFSGRNLHFGIREHGMTAVGNGLALGGYVPFTASFLTFTDYARPGIRLAALMKLRHVFVYTHDSVFLGEDGPTHQSVEHLASLRLIPNLLVLRPADGLETAAAWGLALERRDGPTLLALSRQNLPALVRPDTFKVSDLRRGAYVLRDSQAENAITLFATGSEVAVALDAAEQLATVGLPTRVVSMMSPQTFAQQDAAWRDRVLPQRSSRQPRGRRHGRLGRAARRSRPRDRHRHVRRVRAGRGAGRALRTHRRGGRSPRERLGARALIRHPTCERRGTREGAAPFQLRVRA
jgi:transketolase